MSGPILSYFDTSVLIAAMVRSHPQHSAALGRLQEVRAGRETGWTSAHGITECFSVLTRTPFQPPIHPSDAWRLIEKEILGVLSVIWLDGEEQMAVVRRCARESILGGRVNDATHLRCAAKAGCGRVYTFNLRDFRALAEVGHKMLVTGP